MEVNFEYKGYKVILINIENKQFVFDLSMNEFDEKIKFIHWIDFLVKTKQWVPYKLYNEVFMLEEDKYKEIEFIKEFKVQYVEIVNKYINVNLDLM